jgi:hypothetical protein
MPLSTDPLLYLSPRYHKITPMVVHSVRMIQEDEAHGMLERHLKRSLTRPSHHPDCKWTREQGLKFSRWGPTGGKLMQYMRLLERGMAGVEVDRSVLEQINAHFDNVSDRDLNFFGHQNQEDSLGEATRKRLRETDWDALIRAADVKEQNVKKFKKDYPDDRILAKNIDFIPEIEVSGRPPPQESPESSPEPRPEPEEDCNYINEPSIIEHNPAVGPEIPSSQIGYFPKCDDSEEDEEDVDDEDEDEDEARRENERKDKEDEEDEISSGYDSSNYPTSSQEAAS